MEKINWDKGIRRIILILTCFGVTLLIAGVIKLAVGRRIKIEMDKEKTYVSQSSLTPQNEEEANDPGMWVSLDTHLNSIRDVRKTLYTDETAEKMILVGFGLSVLLWVLYGLVKVLKKPVRSIIDWIAEGFHEKK